MNLPPTCLARSSTSEASTDSPGGRLPVSALGPSPRVWGEPYEWAEKVGATWTIPTRVGRTLDYQQVTAARSKFFRESERLIILFYPLFGHQPQAAKVNVTTIRFAPTFDFEPLTIRFTRQNK
jgi:hypothetical protein